MYYSNTGRTEQVAKDLAKAKNADIMKFEADPEYTEADLDYHNKGGRVSVSKSVSA
ncbi:flavodoxin [uncultured Mitsuokella sp.]|uniref:flavodoxin n=1 Tax=uncultured Mitsuokella sp. TaxID=453120 RepID=UPI002592BD8C|nr:flavodoxin [uncultured Mitsuokella sp.]